MIELQDYDIECIEQQILWTYQAGGHCDYTQCGDLLSVRRRMINRRALAHQEELLPDIIAFNDALTATLRKMYDRACCLWNQMMEQAKENEYVVLAAKCYLSDNYPTLHPIQGDNREDLWGALCDSGWNTLYEDGVTLPTLTFSNRHKCHDTFESLIGMDCPPPNWNEGLNKELTKDLHLTSAFHHLFDHTMFALTDFIYVRDFETKIEITIR